MNLEEIIKIAKETLSEKRFKHSYEVMQRCEELAKIYDIDTNKAKLVGIAHDIAKEMPNEEKFKYIDENNIEIDDIEKNNGALLHGKIGADICKKRFGFTEEMARAVRIHTTGNNNMSILDKILFIADSTSDDRNFDNLDYIVDLGNTDINKAVLYIVEYKIKSNTERNKTIHPNSVLAREDIIKNVCNL